MNDVNNNLYPKIPKDAEVFRLNTCYTILEKIKKYLEYFEMMRDKKSKAHSKLRLVNILTISGATAISIFGSIITGTGIGVVIGLPLISVSSLFNIVSLIAIKLYKNIV